MATRNLQIADGDAGTEQTVSEMSRLICEAALTPTVRRVAVNIVAAVEDDPIEQLTAIRQWVSSHFQFIRDPASGELLHDVTKGPDALLRQISQYGVARGDCDDAAILAGALACAVGFQVALMLVAFAPNAPYSHVWASASAPFPCPDASGRQVWIEMDVTRPAQLQTVPMDRIARAKPILVC